MAQHQLNITESRSQKYIGLTSDEGSGNSLLQGVSGKACYGMLDGAAADGPLGPNAAPACQPAFAAARVKHTGCVIMHKKRTQARFTSQHARRCHRTSTLRT